MKKSLFSLLAIIMIATNIHAQIPTNGLVAYYPFNGNANDSSGNNYHGTNNGATLTTDRFGKANSAYKFNGKNIVTVPIASNLLNTKYTISTWVRLDTIGSTYPTFMRGMNTYFLMMQFMKNSNQFNYYTPIAPNTGGVSIVSNNNVLVGKWYHIVLTNSNDTCKMYLNGKLQSTQYPIHITLNGTYIQIGNGIQSNEIFNGEVDDIAFYKRSLDSNEVNSLYQQSGIATSIPSNGLVAWYPFTGNTLDSSGNNNHGTNNGATLTTDRFGKANSAYSFNGSGNYINCGNKFSLNSFTYSAWINVKNAPTSYFLEIISKLHLQGQIISPDSPYYEFRNSEFRIQSDSTLNGTWGDKSIWTGVTSANKVQMNNWAFATLTYDSLSNAGKVYINGLLVGTHINKLSDIATLPLFIGARPTTGSSIPGVPGFFFNGKLDDIRIYNRALDSSEIQSLYHEGGYTGTLPLHLTTFTATYQNKQSALRWSSTNETNTANFVVERSSNGSSFSQVGVVTAKGSGNNSYGFTDATLTEASTLYYRLKMIDKDGSFTYSQTVQVSIPTSTQAISLAPNPANNSTTVYFKQGVSVGTVSVFNALGVKVVAQEFGGAVRNSFVLPTASLQAGTYIVNVKTALGTYSSKLQIVR